MRPEQEPKYTVSRLGEIVNRASGQAIPDDEPVFIFRARDRHAAAAIEAYAHSCENDEHRRIVLARVDDFHRFTQAHPDRMKEPDSP